MPTPIFPQLWYGDYPFLQGSVWFTISKRPIIGPTGRRVYVHESWSITGRVEGPTNPQVVAACEALEAAIVDGQDLLFTNSSHGIVSANTTEGTHVRLFQWLSGFDGVRGSGAELLLRRTFNLVIDAKYVATSDTDMYAYDETVSGMGTGGPDVVPVMSLFGYPQAQQRRLRTPFSSIQRGRAIGLTTYPAASTPIWQFTPNVYYYPESITTSLSTPKAWGVNVNTLYEIAWAYRAWSPTVAMVVSPSPF